MPKINYEKYQLEKKDRMIVELLEAILEELEKLNDKRLNPSPS